MNPLDEFKAPDFQSADNEDRIRSAISRYVREVLRMQSACVEGLLFARLLGSRYKLVEERVSPTRTVWYFEDDDGILGRVEGRT
jgi:hypothetical protein